MAAAKPKKPAPKPKATKPVGRGPSAGSKKGKPESDAAAGPSTFRPFESLAALKKKAAPKKAKTEAPLAGSGSRRAQDDTMTFRAAMRGVKPLVSGAAQIRVAPPSEDDEGALTLRSLVLDGMTFEVIDDGATLQGRRLDVDPREVRRLRQERYAVDGTLDLHKHSVAEARVAVVQFIARRAREGDKVIAIVHGKGKHSAGGEAVLRGELGAWLSQGDAARHVLAFASAVDRAGESGKLLVRIG